MTNGLNTTLAVADHVALVLDIHHHWINSGEYISAQDPRTMRVIESWRGTRPAMHFSTSREDILVDHDPNVRPDLAELLDRGFKKQKLRAHSDFCWNNAVNDYALTFAENFDIQVEAKGKNLASEQLYEQYISQHL
jgi:UV DNA damage repair endonuclease